jgi:hypothetical protein
VWSVVEELRAPRGWPLNRTWGFMGNSGKGADGHVAPGDSTVRSEATEVENEEDSGGDGYSVSDDSSIMMYSPLMPTVSSFVELAETEFMPTPVGLDEEELSPSSDVVEGITTPEPILSAVPASIFSAKELGAWRNIWPFNVWSAREEGNGNGVDREATSNAEALEVDRQNMETVTDVDLGTVYSDSQPIAGPSRLPPAIDEEVTSTTPSKPPQRKQKRPKSRVRGQLVWVPSTTKLSFEARWWGYRMYVSFPPSSFCFLPFPHWQISSPACS